MGKTILLKYEDNNNFSSLNSLGDEYILYLKTTWFGIFTTYSTIKVTLHFQVDNYPETFKKWNKLIESKKTLK